MVDRRGVPLATGLTAANRPDGTVFAAVLDVVTAVRGRRGRPRQRPAKPHADEVCGIRRYRACLRCRGIADRNARKWWRIRRGWGGIAESRSAHAPGSRAIAA